MIAFTIGGSIRNPLASLMRVEHVPQDAAVPRRLSTTERVMAAFGDGETLGAVEIQQRTGLAYRTVNTGLGLAVSNGRLTQTRVGKGCVYGIAA